MSYFELIPENFVQRTSERVKEFAKRLRSLKSLSIQLSTPQDTPQLRSEISLQREQAFKLSQEIIRAFHTSPNDRAAVLKTNRLYKEFESLLKTYQDLNECILDREKEAVEEEEEKAESHKKESFVFTQIAEFDDTALKERAREVEMIEKDMLMVNNMFKDVSHMMAEQEIELMKAQQHVETAEDETNQALRHLGTANKIQKKSKKKYACIFLVLFVIVASVLSLVVIYSR